MPVKYISGAGRKGDYTYSFGGGANEVIVTDTDPNNNYTIYGGGGLDRLTGGPGADLLFGAKGNDSLAGRDGNDSLFGELGNDYLDGGAGDDYLDGGAGNDYLYGGDGSDELSGGDGDDWLYGLNGADELVGGAGADKFMFASVALSGGVDTVVDYRYAENDEIQVYSGGINLTIARYVSAGGFTPGYSGGHDQYNTVVVGTTDERNSFLADHSASNGTTPVYLAHYFYDTDQNTLYYDSDTDGLFSDAGGFDAVFNLQGISLNMTNIASNLTMLIG